MPAWRRRSRCSFVFDGFAELASGRTHRQVVVVGWNLNRVADECGFFHDQPCPSVMLGDSESLPLIAATSESCSRRILRTRKILERTVPVGMASATATSS